MRKLPWICCLILLATSLYSFSRAYRLEARNEALTKNGEAWTRLALGSDSTSFKSTFDDFESLCGPKGLHVLALSATCGPCIRAAPGWNKMAEERTSAGYGFIGLATSETELENFTAEHGLKFPIVVATEKMMEDLAVAYTPSEIVLDPQGRIKAMGTKVDLLRSTRTEFLKVVESWPEGLADSFFTAIGHSFLGQGVTQSEVRIDEIAAPVHVFETSNGIAGFGVLVHSEQDSVYFSDVEAFIVTDESGGVIGVVPLRSVNCPGGTVDRDEIERWARDRDLMSSANRAVQERDFQRDLRAARVALGFSSVPPR